MASCEILRVPVSLPAADDEDPGEGGPGAAGVLAAGGPGGGPGHPLLHPPLAGRAEPRHPTPALPRPHWPAPPNEVTPGTLFFGIDLFMDQITIKTSNPKNVVFTGV
jgi:hypothetical protein